MKGSGLGYAILAIVMLFLWGLAKLLQGIVSCLVGTAVQRSADRNALSRAPYSPTAVPAPPTAVAASCEADLLCPYCKPCFHDGGRRCIKCGAWTRASQYAICHECAAGRTTAQRCCACEMCTQLL